MTKPNNIFAFLAYLLLVPGWLSVLIFCRKDELARFHARQSLILNLFVVMLFVGWFGVTWLVIGIPIAGPLLAFFLFATVLALLIFAVIVWIVGMVRALLSKKAQLPIIGNWAQKLPF